jgi:hypothetical protein
VTRPSQFAVQHELTSLLRNPRNPPGPGKKRHQSANESVRSFYMDKNIEAATTLLI